MLPQNKHNRLMLWKQAQNIRRRVPERSRCPMDPDTEIQSLETSRTMFIVAFTDAGDIYMINSIHRQHRYHLILQRRALTSRKRLCE